MRAVHLQRQRIITQAFSGRDTAYNSLLPKFISPESTEREREREGDGWGGAFV